MAENVQRIPPLLNETRRGRAPAIFLAGVAAALLVARVSEHWHLPFMKCSFKALTSLPCATCGGTRALRALSRLEFVEAFWLNPLVMVAGMVAALWFLLWLGFPEIEGRLKKRVTNWPLLKLGILAALLNWIFLVLFLPE
jgi:hypothetical protein